MSGITVIDGDGELQEFEEATTWHVDDHGRLHVLGDEKRQVATFAKDRWHGAAHSEASGLTLAAQTVALQAHTEQLAEIHESLRRIESAVTA